VSLTDRAKWTMTRVYSAYTSREVFTDPAGVQWVRVSEDAFKPERGDIQVDVKTRGLRPILLRRADALAGNLKREAV
jgi:hypothetical protein